MLGDRVLPPATSFALSNEDNLPSRTAATWTDRSCQSCCRCCLMLIAGCKTVVPWQCASLPSSQRRQAKVPRLQSCGAVPASRVAKRRQRLRCQSHAPSALGYLGGSGFGKGWRGLGNISGCVRPAVPCASGYSGLHAPQGACAPSLVLSAIWRRGISIVESCFDCCSYLSDLSQGVAAQAAWEGLHHLLKISRSHATLNAAVVA